MDGWNGEWVGGSSWMGGWMEGKPCLFKQVIRVLGVKRTRATKALKIVKKEESAAVGHKSECPRCPDSVTKRRKRGGELAHELNVRAPPPITQCRRFRYANHVTFEAKPEEAHLPLPPRPLVSFAC